MNRRLLAVPCSLFPVPLLLVLGACRPDAPPRATGTLEIVEIDVRVGSVPLPVAAAPTSRTSSSVASTCAISARNTG